MKALFICPRFFGYENEISEALHRAGYDVTYFDEKPYNNFFFKVLLRVWKNNFLVKKIINNYFAKLLNSAPEKVDIIIVLKGESLTENIVKSIRAKYKKTKMVFYAWDSIVNYPQVQDYLYLFDKKYTFDDRDINKFKNLEHLPLFFSPEFSKVNVQESHARVSPKKRIAFLGSVHSDRYVLLGKIYQKYKHTFELDFVLYFPSIVMLLGFIATNIKNVFRYKLYSFTIHSRSKKEVVCLFKNADAILDIQHPGQSGLTMRTLECLPLQIKMITTNIEIKNYEFYNECNYFFLDRNELTLSSEFFAKEFQPTDPNVINKYSVDYWVKTLCN
ncbi:hypothetical protein ACMV8I_06645 [Ewingella sp. S1.OA.A_B6]